jgi:hypothetical protein
VKLGNVSAMLGILVEKFEDYTQQKQINVLWELPEDYAVTVVGVAT